MKMTGKRIVHRKIPQSVWLRITMLVGIPMLAVFFLLLAGCRMENRPAETTPAISTPVERPNASREEPLARRPVWSRSLFVKDDYIFFVHPATNRLMRYHVTNEIGEILWSQPVYEFFFLSGNKLYVRNLDDGFLYSLDTDGEKVERLFSIPFEDGLLLGDVMYLLARPEGESAILYQYEPKHGFWSMYILEGSHQWDTDAAVFGNGILYYVQETAGRESVIARTLDTGQKVEAYQALYPGKGQLHSLIWQNGVLYFIDEGSGLCAVDDTGEVSRLPTEGNRVLAVLSDGILLGNSQKAHDSIFYGNKEGHGVEFSSGIVHAGYGMRAVISRQNSAGKERIALVKYPEDEEQAVLTGSLAVLKVGQQHALAMFYDWDEYFLLNLLTGEAERLAGDTIEPTHVTIKTYLEETSKNQTPYQEEVDKASPATLAQLYAAAFCRNDRYTMSRLSSNGAKLPLFYPCYAKGFRLSKLEETDKRFVFALDLSGFASAGHIAHLPPNMQQARLVVTRTSAGWKVNLE
ncbi:MAG TPA: hypothetical protein GX701_09135 [Clostridiales bacterium]|nr:hypothetical protein [Clostridiales bacterium]